MHRNRTWFVDATKTVLRTQRNRILPIEGVDGSTLSLDFTTGVLDSRLTFTRASTGTFINSSGLVETMAAAPTNDPTKARFDHDPTTLAPKGLLIEATATNLLSRSEEFNLEGPWYKFNATITANDGTAPDGNTTADSIQATTPGQGGIFRFNEVPNGTHTFSVFAKANGANSFLISVDTSGNGRGVEFTLTSGGSAGTPYVRGTGGTVTSLTASVQAFQNGWVRCIVTVVTTGSNNVAIYRDSGTSKWLAWGAQLEAGSGASSYIPTGASTVQRLADICYIPDGDHLWFTSKNNCVLFMQCEIPRTSNFGNLMYLGQWSGAEYSYGYQLYSYAATAVSANTKINAATSTDQALFGNQSVPISLKIAMCPNSDAARLARAWNGTASETTGLTPTASRFPAWTQQARFGIGTNAASLGSSTACNIYVRTVKFFPFAMSNAQLQAITT